MSESAASNATVQSRAREDGSDRLAKARQLHEALVGPLTETDRRVAHILDLMEAQVYVPGVTSRELAAEWNINLSAVEHLTAQAARIQRLAATPEIVAARVARRLDGWLEWADTAPDRVQLAKLRLEAVGAMGPRAERRAEMAAPTGPNPERIAALFDSPPPELQALLLGWVERNANAPELVQLLEANGWERRER